MSALNLATGALIAATSLAKAPFARAVPLETTPQDVLAEVNEISVKVRDLKVATEAFDGSLTGAIVSVQIL